MAAIITFAEHRDGKLRRPSLEAVSEARRLAGAGGRVESVLVGAGADFAGLAQELARYGADAVHVFDKPELAHYATEPFARAIAQVLTDQKAQALLVPFTAMGKDLAPRVAAKLGAGLVSDCVSLVVKDGRLEARRPLYAGKALATVRFESEPQIATLRPNVFALAAPDAARTAEVVARTVDASSRAKVVEVKATASGKIELSEAQIIVSGGRGLKGPENFHLVESLAQALGAAVGASRAVVDAGWVDHQYQVGQTGKTVSPSLYVAAGISGAIQHLAGMSSSKVIVAINKDADAPIFKVANYGLLGDVFDILPKLTEAAKAHLASKQ
ncbi:MAG TPA: electron transfer flavoprotein subunit alpha/FixB family protein [Vicinamibacteria bacterium]|nr:electron transfer flavoprotein subunit alpha/FixB family protein [Vicinamibacteria bacterium]